MKGKVTFDGFDDLERRFRAAGPKAREPLFGALKDGAQRMENRAKKGIAKGPKTGKVYTQRFATNRKTGQVFAYGKRVPHQASAPGEYPAGDTSNLEGGIRHEPVSETAERLHIDLQANAAYAAPLELKPPEKGGRPFLGRAADEEADSVVEDAIDRLIAGGLP
jgi:hypothetical protein